MSDYFFEVEPLTIKQEEHFNPVSRKIMDIRVYEGEELQYSSIACKYIKQAQNNELITEQKQLKLDIEEVLRSAYEFPSPVRVDYDGDNENVIALNNLLKVGVQQAIDAPDLINQEVIDQYVKTADSFPQLQLQKQNNVLSQEILAFYQISLQMPPVNSIGEAFRKFTKKVGCSTEIVKFFEAINEKMFESAITRKWEGEERKAIIKRVFGLAKLFLHTGVIHESYFAEIVCCCVENNSLRIEESIDALFGEDNILSWIIAFPGIANELCRAGMFRKLINIFDYLCKNLESTTEEQIDQAAQVGYLILKTKNFRTKLPPIKQMAMLLDKAVKLREETENAMSIKDLDGMIKILSKNNK